MTQTGIINGNKEDTENHIQEAENRHEMVITIEESLYSVQLHLLKKLPIK